jgi:hypothetical protein
VFPDLRWLLQTVVESMTVGYGHVRVERRRHQAHSPQSPATQVTLAH